MTLYRVPHLAPVAAVGETKLTVRPHGAVERDTADAAQMDLATKGKVRFEICYVPAKAQVPAE